MKELLDLEILRTPIHVKNHTKKLTILKENVKGNTISKGADCVYDVLEYDGDNCYTPGGGST